MRQKIRQLFLFLCMISCAFSLVACQSRRTKEPIPESIEVGMKSGARSYLTQFDSYDDVTLAEELERLQRQNNTVMEEAVLSWMECKDDLGDLLQIDAEAVERLDEMTYQVTLEAEFELRRLTFVLKAEEALNHSYEGGGTLVPLELTFQPDYTIGELFFATAGIVLLCLAAGSLILVLIAVLTGQLARIHARKN